MLDERVRGEFPILAQIVHGKPLVYLDSAATAQKPQCVIDEEANFYRTCNAGVHRGTHELAALSTELFESSRAKIARAIGAKWQEGTEELIVCSGATQALNLLATSLGYAASVSTKVCGRHFELGPGKTIVVTRAEHHAVLLPFQELARRTGATLSWLDVDDEGRIRTEDVDRVITEQTVIVAFTHTSNVTGAITDVQPIVQRAQAVGALTVLDMCQSAAHIPVDVAKLGVDFAAFSAHKMYGPTGVGFLYGRRELLEALPPASFGGSMVSLAWMDKPAQYMPPPQKFEAGTQPMAQLVAAAKAMEWLQHLGFEAIMAHERVLLQSLLRMRELPGLRILGPDNEFKRLALVSFDVEGVHPHDVGQYMDARGIAIRVGHHCAQPIHRHFGLFASSRVSTGVYTTLDEIETFMEALSTVRQFFLS